MRKKRKGSKVLIFLFAVFVILALVLYREYRPVSTPSIRDESGNLRDNSIAVIESVPLGGMEQWIQIRGADTDNPVLLWVHGGPGSAQMPVSSRTRALENDFVVVHWDQRGAGKSNPRGFDEDTMTVERYVRDIHELTGYLKQRLNRDKIYLLGHSFGTHIGLLAVRDRPEDYLAYIGVGQLVYWDARCDELNYAWLRNTIGGSEAGQKALAKIGPPPYDEHERYVRFAKLVDQNGGGMDIGFAELAFTALGANEYRISDLWRWLGGANRGSGPMWEETRRWDAAAEVPSLSVPVYLFAGRNDHNTPLVLAEEYLAKLTAEKKELVVFEHSAHTPFFAEPERFIAAMHRVRDETCGSTQKS